MLKTARFFLIISLILGPLAGCNGGAPTVLPATLPATRAPQLVAEPLDPTPTPMPSEEPQTSTGEFQLTSSAVEEGGMLPVEYTCDGASDTLALAWSGAPEGTQSYAVIMHHEASPTDIHWYWVLYDLPASVTSLPKNVSGIGTLGINSVNGQSAYTPPCSKGPGPKIYIYTVYALSAEPALAVPPDQVNRAVLLEAIQKITLASAELHVVYSRK